MPGYFRVPFLFFNSRQTCFVSRQYGSFVFRRREWRRLVFIYTLAHWKKQQHDEESCVVNLVKGVFQLLFWVKIRHQESIIFQSSRLCSTVSDFVFCCYSQNTTRNTEYKQCTPGINSEHRKWMSYVAYFLFYTKRGFHDQSGYFWTNSSRCIHTLIDLR